METDFAEWLQIEMDRRGWDQAELARRARITPAQVSRVMGGTRGAGKDFLLKISGALSVPLEDVLRRAGFLPPYTELPDEAKSWGSRLMALQPELRGLALDSMEAALKAIEGAAQLPRR